MKVLHIIRREEDQLVRGIIEYDMTVRDASILLIQDGVLSRFKFRDEAKVFASVNDVEARGINVYYNLVDYPAICQLILEHDKVIVW